MRDEEPWHARRSQGEDIRRPLDVFIGNQSLITNLTGSDAEALNLIVRKDCCRRAGHVYCDFLKIANTTSVLDEGANVALKLGHGAMDTTSDCALRQQAQLSFDLVDPRGGG